jgi:hypothetical protein
MLGGYLALDALIIGISAGVSPVSATTYEFQISDFQDIDREMCSDGSSIFPYFGYTLVALPVVAALFLAYKTRNVQGDFTENRPILYSLYTFAFAAIVMVPITYLLGQENVGMVFYLDSFGILVVSTVSVLAFMVPKIIQQHRPVVLPTGSTFASNTAASTGVYNSNMAMDTDEIEHEMLTLKAKVDVRELTIKQLKEALKAYVAGDKPDVSALLGTAAPAPKGRPMAATPASAGGDGPPPHSEEERGSKSRVDAPEKSP